MWVNSYLPPDQGLAVFNEEELRNTLAAVNWAIENTQCDFICRNGDLNSDFSRHSTHVNIVRNFLEEKQLKKAHDNFHFDFTYCAPSDTSFSLVDHFIYNGELSDHISQSGVLHRGDNISGHDEV